VDQKSLELWECITAGTVIVWTWDAGRKDYRTVSVNGTGGPKRLRISAEDREYNQSLIADDRRGLDPFTNGRLALVVDGQVTGVITNADLHEMLKIRDEAAFTEALQHVAGDELIIRRLKDVAEHDGTISQYEAVRQVVLDRYHVGGTQRTVAEMIEAGEAVGGIRLS
jgi:hypothetical protein